MNPLKLHIKTYGCQMNEYDSSKMADVLKAHATITMTDQCRRSRYSIAQYLLGAREGARKSIF